MTRFEQMIARAQLLEREASGHIGYIYRYDKVTQESTEEYHSSFTGDVYPTQEKAYQANIEWLNETIE